MRNHQELMGLAPTSSNRYQKVLRVMSAASPGANRAINTGAVHMQTTTNDMHNCTLSCERKVNDSHRPKQPRKPIWQANTRRRKGAARGWIMPVNSPATQV